MSTTDAASVVKKAMRRDLASAMKARRSGVVSALRNAIAVLDNAESVDVQTVRSVEGAIANASEGLGSSEVARRTLSAADVDTILRGHVEEILTEAQRYDELGHSDAAQRLRREADVVLGYL